MFVRPHVLHSTCFLIFTSWSRNPLVNLRLVFNPLPSVLRQSMSASNFTYQDASCKWKNASPLIPGKMNSYFVTLPINYVYLFPWIQHLYAPDHVRSALDATRGLQSNFGNSKDVIGPYSRFCRPRSPWIIDSVRIFLEFHRDSRCLNKSVLRHQPSGVLFLALTTVLL